MNRIIPIALLCLTVSACGGSGGGSSVETPTKPANQAPDIAPLAAITAFERDEIKVTATASDSDGQISSYQWQQTSGPEVQFIENNSAELVFVAPTLDADAELQFELTVTDNQGAKATETLSVSLSAYGLIETSLFTDKSLLSCVNAKEADVGINELNCADLPVSSLEGIEQLSKLQSLAVQGPVSDLQVLENLAELKSLHLLSKSYGQSLSLPDLPQLQHLSIDNVRIQNLTETLSDKTNLLTLSVIGNGYYDEIDWAEMTHLTQLRELELEASYSSNYESLAQLTALEKLRLVNANLRTLSFLPKLPNLIELDISYNPLYDFTAMNELTGLQKLTLGGLRMEDASWLSEMTGLQELIISDISNSNGFDLSHISGLSQLTKLQLSNIRNLRQVDSLAGLTNLTHLEMVSNNLSSVAFLAKLTKLEELSLENNERISDISHLNQLSNLQTLNLSGLRNLSELSPLKGLTSLTSLNLRNVDDYRSTIDGSILAELSQLTYLDIRYTGVQDWDFLSSLTNLQTLLATRISYSGYKLPDLSGLTALHSVEFGSMSHDDLLGLGDNPSIVSLKLSQFDGEDLSSFANLLTLENLEIISFYGAESAAGLTSLVNLKTLTLPNSSLKVLPELSALSKLESLNLESSALENLDFLQNMPALKNLNVRSSYSLTCKALENFSESYPDVVVLKPGGCVEVPVSSLSFADANLQECARQENPDAMDIRYLTCYQTITNVQGISQLVNLRSLSLNRVNNDTNFDDLAKLDNLTTLELQGESRQALTNLSKLPSLPKVEGMTLSGTGLEDLSTLPVIPNLKRLNIRSSELRSLSGLAGFPGVTSLDADYSKLVDVSAAFNHPALNNLSLYGVSTVSCADLETLRQNINYVGHSGSCTE